MNKHTKSKSIRRVENGRRAIRIFNTQMRDTFPLCGAKAKSTGRPCRRFAMANGRCNLHGGRTPKKDKWHRPRWPNKNTPNANEKLNRKLLDLERAYRRREQRLAAMTKEQRAKYDKWWNSHAPGSAAQRNANRLRHRQNAEARKILETLSQGPSDPEIERLERLIAELEADKLILEHGSVFD